MFFMDSPYFLSQSELARHNVGGSRRDGNVAVGQARIRREIAFDCHKAFSDRLRSRAHCVLAQVKRRCSRVIGFAAE
jgi:hypothetical protein